MAKESENAHDEIAVVGAVDEDDDGFGGVAGCGDEGVQVGIASVG